LLEESSENRNWRQNQLNAVVGASLLAKAFDFASPASWLLQHANAVMDYWGLKQIAVQIQLQLS